MSWITPLGLLGLIGIAVLILIYLLKPNYQQKIISSTHVWRLSLKYKRKKVPINKLRNILIFICQVLIITACAFILTQPFIPEDESEKKQERVAIIDISASMLANDGDTSRFERAVEAVRLSVDEILDEDGVVSVITAGRRAEFLARRVDSLQADLVYQRLDELLDRGCEYASSDISGAVSLTQELIQENPELDVEIYSGYKGTSDGFNERVHTDEKKKESYQLLSLGGDAVDEHVRLYNMADEDEWNAAILDARAELVENWYTISVDLACYGNGSSIAVVCDVYGLNGAPRESAPMTMRANPFCTVGEKNTVVFDYSDGMDGSMRIASFDYIYVHLEEVKDNYAYDNSFYIYGGTRETVRVQYSSSAPGLFIPSVLMNWRSRSEDWNVEITELKADAAYETEGFDLYVFEHRMPDIMPTDGVVLLIDPDKSPVGLGMQFGDPMNGDFNLAAGVPHAVTEHLIPDNIYVSNYRRVTLWNGFDPVIYCGGDPIFLIKNEPFEKVAVLSTSINMSDISILAEFPILFYNMFDYFFPATVEENLYNVYDEISLNARGDTVRVTDQAGSASTFHRVPTGGAKEVDTLYFPDDKFTPLTPGTYTMAQTLISNKPINEYIYVRILSSESNICDGFKDFKGPSRPEVLNGDFDLIIFIAAALVALLFAEWWLQSRDQF